jgi:hypothetical protein
MFSETVTNILKGHLKNILTDQALAKAIENQLESYVETVEEFCDDLATRYGNFVSTL